LLDDDGSLTAMFGATQDITDLRRAQRADFARQKLESIGTLASGIAHDFNNLLGSVLVQAEVALGELRAGSNPEEELKMIRNVAMRGSEIVRELMVYAGKESATVELVDVSRIIQEMLELLKVSVSKHAALEADLGKNLPPVRANAAQLRQIVMNLVTNASDALGDRDGVIRLSTRCVRVDQDSQLGHLDEGNYTLLEVADTGCGMTPETQAKVFDPFFTTKFAGHGLGLAIVDGIVRGLRGMIRLSSEPGKGTTFQILLPCAESRAGGGGHTISGLDENLESQFRHATVLIVEDEGPLRQAVTKMLRKTGFKVFEVADGSSAIDLLRANGGSIDLILLDMTIPGAPSSEVVAEAGKVRPDIRVVLTSAYSQEMIAGAMNAPQIRGFIRKPFQLGDLVKKLKNTLVMG
jgi:two-component system cell cycle sensor histidine kinase/response regulator CckA